MLERLGYVLGWTANILAVLVLIFSAVMYVVLSKDPASVRDPQFPFWFALGGCVVALVIFLIGRALRYIFAGR